MEWFEVIGLFACILAVLGLIMLGINAQDMLMDRKMVRESLEEAVAQGRIGDVRAALIVNRKKLPKSVVKDAEWWLAHREDQAGNRVL